MTHTAKVVADSISEEGVRLTTFEVRLPRIVLAELNTHRMFSRNSASSRAIPVEKMIKMVWENPYVPSTWGKNQRGMQAGEEVSAEVRELCVYKWLEARDRAVEQAEQLLECGIHKQITNRLLEPFLWHTVVITATEYENFFNLRNNDAAHPDIQRPAALMQELYESHKPTLRRREEWHLPYIFPEDVEAVDMDLTGPGTFTAAQHEEMLTTLLVKISSARCARVSYLTHDGRRNYLEDLNLYSRLRVSGHMSPFEHPARPATEEDCLNAHAQTWFGNFRGWIQHRKHIPHEDNILSAAGKAFLATLTEVEL